MLRKRYDVIVVGAGLAGATAALSAAEAGAKVLLLEKMDEPGGSTVLSSGLMAFAGTDEQQAQGLIDTPDAMRDDLLATGKNANDRKLVEAYCREQRATYQWLKGIGVEFGAVHAASGQSVARSHSTDAHAMLSAILKTAREAGVQLVTDAPVTGLIETGGSVTGVRSRIQDEACEVAARAVVLTTGGFSRNEELLGRHAPRMAAALRGGGLGNMGDGLKMAQQVGAGARDFQHIKGTFGIHPFSRDTTGILAIYKGAIAVDVHGRRFVDESLPYKEVGDACLELDGAGAYQVFDQQVLEAGDSAVPIYDFRARVRRGEILSAPSLRELAHLIQVDADTLEGTVAAYNRAVAFGSPDPFGRIHLSGRVGRPFPLQAPPFHAFPTATVVLATYCGLTVSPSGEVLDRAGDAIPGLFAAGEVIGGFHGAGYVTGTSLGKSAVFGRLVGLAAVA